MSGTNAIARRALLRGSLGLAALPLLAACGLDDSVSSQAAPSDPARPTPSRQQPRVLMAYFSRAGENYWNGGRKDLAVGNTEVVARMIAELADVGTYRILAADPYPHDYEATVARNVREQQDDARPRIVGTLPDSSGYDMVLLGSPVWNVQEPMIMRTGVLDNDGRRVGEGMPIRVVLDHEHAHAWPRVLRLVEVPIGAALVLIGVLLGQVGIVLGLGLAAQFISDVTGSSIPGEERVFDELPWSYSLLVLTSVVCIASLVLGLRYGMRLVRGNRGVVLFLRRFKDLEAIGAVTFAAAGGPGSRWRVVTLDDAVIEPMGIPPGQRRFFKGLTWVGSTPAFVLQWVPRLTGVLVLSIGAVLAFGYYRTGVWDLDPLANSLPGDDAFLGFIPPPPGPLGWDQQTLVYLLVVSLIVSAAVGIALFVVMLVALVLIGPLVLAMGAIEEAEKADSTRQAPIHTVSELPGRTAAVRAGSRRVLAPRLVVVKVDTQIWQDAVAQFTKVADAVVMDVSEVTRHVLWEVEHVRGSGTRLVLVGHVPELDPLTRAAEGVAGPTQPASAGHAGGETAAERADRKAQEYREMSELLDGREVLGYTLDRRGQRRFARALRSTLMCRDLHQGAG